MKGKCFIFGALPIERLTVKPQNGDFVIAADKGILNCRKFGIRCDIIIGDFDSLGYIPAEGNVTVLPTHKDDTDVGYAMEKAFAMGFREFFIYGAVGGREDMTYANVQLAASLSRRGCFAVFFGNNQSFTAVTEGVLKFPVESSGRISVFSVSDICRGVTLKGLEYNLDSGVLGAFYPLGVSNSFVGNGAEISVEEGTLAVFFDADNIPGLF